MQRFKSPGHAQRFLSAYGPISPHFRPRRHLLPADEYRRVMADRFEIWREVTGLVTAEEVTTSSAKCVCISARLCQLNNLTVP